MKSAGFFKPRDTHEGAKQLFYYYYYYLLFLKVPHEIRCWPTSLLQHFFFLNSLSPQGSVLFTVPSSKQPLPSGAKQTTYTTHSWDFCPCHRCPPLPNTHNFLTPSSVTVVRGAGPGSIELLWRTWPSTPHNAPDEWKSGSPRMPGRARSAFCDRPELRHKQTDVMNLYIRFYTLCLNSAFLTFPLC